MRTGTLLSSVIFSLALLGLFAAAHAQLGLAPATLSGDGVTDDAPALQKLIDSGIGAIVLPKGQYLLKTGLVVDLDKVGLTAFQGQGGANLVMAGPGPAIKFIGTHFKSADPAGYEERVWLRQRMPMVDGLGIEGKHDEAIGIEAVGTMQLTVTRTHIRGCLHGIHLAENNRNVLISECHIYENKGIGVFYDQVNLHQSNITGCHISYCDRGGVVSLGGNVRNLHITGCDIESNMSPETEATANVLIDCRGSEYGTGEVAITGCTIQHNNPSPGSANIRIIGHSDASKNASPVHEGNVTISGNVLSDVKVNVHLQRCRGVTLTGNTFWQGYEHNLLVEECSSIVMGANNLDRNPRYDYGNTADANNPILFRDCRDCTISGLHVSSVWRSPAAVHLLRCERCNISDCTVLDSDSVGLLLEDIKHCKISGCLIRDDRENASSLAVKLTGERNLFTNNLLGRPVEILQGNAVVQGNVVE